MAGNNISQQHLPTTSPNNISQQHLPTTSPNNEYLACSGGVAIRLSEHNCEDWLEGYLLTSHVWRQDHTGFTHQNPSFINMVVNKKANVVPVYLSPDESLCE